MTRRLAVLLGILALLVAAFFVLWGDWFLTRFGEPDRTVLMRITDRSTPDEVADLMRAGGWYRARPGPLQPETWRAEDDLLIVHYDETGTAFAAYFARVEARPERSGLAGIAARFGIAFP